MTFLYLLLPVLILTLVIILLYIVYLPPICLIEFFQRRWPDILWRVEISNHSHSCISEPEYNGQEEETDGQTDSLKKKKECFIALTIDDTPSPTYTREILNVLLAHDAHATFFVIASHVPKLLGSGLPAEIPAPTTTGGGTITSGSKCANHGEETTRPRRWDTSSDAFRTLCLLVENGMELANHGLYDEPAFRIDMSLDGGELKRQIEEVEELIDCVYDYVYFDLAAVVSGEAKMDQSSSTTQQAGTRTRTTMRKQRRKFYRPGSGFFTTQMREMIAREFPGMRIALGDVYPHDAQIRVWWMNAWHVLRGVRKNSSTGRTGSIVIVHDGRDGVGRMLTRVLAELKNDPRTEWRVMSLGELLDRAG